MHLNFRHSLWFFMANLIILTNPWFIYIPLCSYKYYPLNIWVFGYELAWKIDHISISLRKLLHRQLKQINRLLQKLTKDQFLLQLQLRELYFFNCCLSHHERYFLLNLSITHWLVLTLFKFFQEFQWQVKSAKPNHQ